MNIISGIVKKGEMPLEGNVLERMRTLAPATETSWNESNADHSSLTTSFPASLYVDSSSGLTIAGDITLYNREHLSRTLLKDPSFPDIRLVLEAWKKWGADCVKHFTGDFAFVILNDKMPFVFCARDPLGQVPFFYFLDQDFLVFSSHIRCVFAGPSVPSELDEYWTLGFLQKQNLFKDRSVFEKIKRLLPGHTLTITKDKEKLECYWSLQEFPSRTGITAEDAVDGLRVHLQEAVSSRFTTGKMGIELSGGLDSSAIAALAQCSLKGSPLVAFSNILPESQQGLFENYTDEWKKSSQVAEFTGIREHFPVDRLVYDSLEMIDKTLDVLGYPTNFNFTAYQHGVYEKARQQGVSLLLSGFGGDELVSQGSTGRYPFTLMKAGRYDKLIRYRMEQGDSPFRALLETARWSGRFFLGTGDRKLGRYGDIKAANDLVPAELLRRLATSTPLFKGPVSGNDTVRERALVRVNAPDLTERLETGYGFTNAYGMRYSYPLLHTPLLEYYFSLPDALKARAPRFLLRESLKGLLPEEIRMQNKPRDTSTIPFARIEAYKDYDRLLEYALSLDKSHLIFNFTDRSKLVLYRSSSDPTAQSNRYNRLKCVVMMSRFMDKLQDTGRNE